MAHLPGQVLICWRQWSVSLHSSSGEMTEHTTADREARSSEDAAAAAVDPASPSPVIEVQHHNSAPAGGGGR